MTLLPNTEIRLRAVDGARETVIFNTDLLRLEEPARVEKRVRMRVSYPIDQSDAEVRPLAAEPDRETLPFAFYASKTGTPFERQLAINSLRRLWALADGRRRVSILMNAGGIPTCTTTHLHIIS